MRKIVDVLAALAVLAFLLGVGFRFLSPNMGFQISESFVTPLFLWRGGMGLLSIAGVLLLRQIRDTLSARTLEARQGAAPATGSRSA